MSKLSKYQERALLKAEKQEILDLASEAFKIQRLTLEEESLLKEALSYAIHDHSGKYEDRHTLNRKSKYLICGILYNHLPVKQIEYGTPLYPSRYDAIVQDELAF